jgi:hypothetical protein
MILVIGTSAIVWYSAKREREQRNKNAGSRAVVTVLCRVVVSVRLAVEFFCLDVLCL